jgi:hypothetical protein
MKGGINSCTKCGSDTYVMPLHGERGGPPFCPICAGAWHAEHGRIRRARRIVVKALRGYTEAGGKLYGKDFDELKLAAGGLFVPYESDTSGADFADLTSELLAATIALTHPDKHPPERKAEANRVSQELQALKPFVFPAPEPEPPPTPKPRDVCVNQCGEELNKTSQPEYPCEDCRDTIPMYYCNPCKTRWEEELKKEDEREEEERKYRNASQRQRYEIHKEWRMKRQGQTACATCAREFKPKRSDAKYCSAACRQRAYLKRDGKPSNSKPLGTEHIERTIAGLFTSKSDNHFTTDELCQRVYVGLKQVERKHRAAVLPIAKRICESGYWDWFQAECRGATLIFWNRISVTSYGMARLWS